MLRSGFGFRQFSIHFVQLSHNLLLLREGGVPTIFWAGIPIRAPLKSRFGNRDTHFLLPFFPSSIGGIRRGLEVLPPALPSSRRCGIWGGYRDKIIFGYEKANSFIFLVSFFIDNCFWCNSFTIIICCIREISRISINSRTRSDNLISIIQGIIIS